MATKQSRSSRAHRGESRKRRSKTFGTLDELKAEVRAECERRYNTQSAATWETGRAKRIEFFGKEVPGPPVWGPSIAILYSGDFLYSWPECEVILREMHQQLRESFVRLALFIQQNHLAPPAFACTERMMKWGMVFLPEILGPGVFGPEGKGPWGPVEAAPIWWTPQQARKCVRSDPWPEHEGSSRKSSKQRRSSSAGLETGASARWPRTWT